MPEVDTNKCNLRRTNNGAITRKCSTVAIGHTTRIRTSLGGGTWLVRCAIPVRCHSHVVKSFHLYLRKPATTPVRVVTDYAPEDVAVFRERFRLMAEHYHRRSRRAMFGIGAFFLCLILGMTLPKHLFLYFWAGGICSWLFVVFAAPSTPDCPACHSQLDASLGAFCPECGSRSLQPGGWFRSPRCDCCRKSLRRGKGRHFKIRACTHCGVMLDEKGF